MSIDQVIVALDVPELDAAVELASLLEGHVGWFKVGLELFGAHGPEAVHQIRPYGKIFLDLKLHDIPTTVERAAARIASLDVDLLTVHALGGPVMIRAAVEGLGSPGRVLAVTILTSMSVHDLAAVGLPSSGHVARLARMAVDASAPGLVCSGTEVSQVRAAVGSDALLVTPGVRPSGAGDDDHAAITTPANALAAGADLLVIGRPITRAHDPAAAADAIVAELVNAGQVTP